MNYGWIAFLVLFAAGCIYSKIGEIHYLYSNLFLLLPYILFTLLFANLVIDGKVTFKMFFLTLLLAFVCCSAVEFIRCFVVEGKAAFQIIVGLLITEDTNNIDPQLYDTFSTNCAIIFAADLIIMIYCLIENKINYRQ